LQHLVTSNKEDLINDFIHQFEQEVNEIKVFKPIEKYLGMEVKEDDNRVYISQKKYILEDVNLLEIENNCKETFYPMSSNVNLHTSVKDPTLEPLLPVSGTLRYLSDRSRPDILTAVGEISSNGHPHPSKEHVSTAKQIIRYLKTTHDLTLNLGGNGPIKLFGFSDAQYNTHGKCMSRLGGVWFGGYDSGTIMSFSQNDTTVSHSSTESEIKAIDLNIRTGNHLRDILEFLGHPQNVPTPLYVDSQSSIELLNTLKTSIKTRHINVRINYLRQELNRKSIELIFIPGELNVADINTKPLNGRSFLDKRFKMMKGFENDQRNILQYIVSDKSKNVPPEI
jgi:hypothetical protein